MTGMWPVSIAACVGIAIASALSADIRGTVPAALGPPSRIAWIGADELEQALCQLQPPRSWTCEGLSPESRGLVVLVGDGGVAVSAVGFGDAAGLVSAALWGRVLRVTPGGVAPEDLRDLRATAWKPDRSNARRQTRRFVPVEDASVHVLRLSNAAFWISGGKIDAVDDAAFIQLEGQASASVRLRTKILIDGPPEVPFFVTALAPSSLNGRVQSVHGQQVEAADVELFEPVELSGGDEPDTKRLEANGVAQVLVRRATAATRSDGSFEFEGLSAGRYEIVASHASLGRGIARVEQLADPIVVKLIPPARAIGRVVRRGLPAAGTRVRFVPDSTAWMASIDPAMHLAAEAFTDADGRFVVTLPADRTGSLQVVASDGAVRRVPLPVLSGRSATGDLMLGDVVLPEHRRLTVRLLDAVPCDLIAIGPIGALGLSIIHATRASGVHWFELPEPGRWSLHAECAGKAYAVEPLLVTIPADGPELIVEARLTSPQTRPEQR